MEESSANKPNKEGEYPLPDSTTINNIQAWISAPHPRVGNNAAPLTATTAGQDTAGMAGCRSQNFTTWNCTCRSYIAGITSWDKKNISCPPDTDLNLGVMDYTPISDIYQIRLLYPDLTTMEAKEISKGRRVYVRGYGVVSKTRAREITQKHQLRAPTFNNVSSIDVFDKDTVWLDPDEPDQSTPREEEAVAAATAGTYCYSDTLPVKCFQPTSWLRGPSVNREPPYSPFFNSISERLSDSNPTTALMTSLKAPTVRDMGSIASLAKFLKHADENYREVSAILRVLCIGISTDKFAYSADPIYYKFVRRFNYVYSLDQPATGAIVPFTAEQLPQLNFIVVPLDIAVSYAVNKGTVAGTYAYNDLDVTWTMVPIRQTAVNNPWAFLYVMSFLDSCYWNGTVNWSTDGVWMDPDFNSAKQGIPQVRYTTMPAANSVRIPGPTNVMLVLIDCVSNSCNSQIRLSYGAGSVQLPVVRNLTPAANPSNCTAIWVGYWITNNIPMINTHAAAVYNELCNLMAVEDSCGTAMSLASEAMLVSFPGLGMDPLHAGVGYEALPNGSWAWGSDDNSDSGGTIDSKDGELDSKNWRKPWKAADSGARRELLVGFNFSAITPLHQHTTGLVKVTYNVNDGVKDGHYYVMTVQWGNCGAGANPIQYYQAKYQVPTCSSLMRLSISCGLIETRDQGYLLKSGAATANFLNMQGMALSGSMALFLSSNDLSVNHWLGWNSTFDQTLRNSFYQNITKRATQWLVMWSDMASVLAATNEWGWDKIDEYYGLDPTTSPDIFSHSPIPIHFFLQWSKKLEYNQTCPEFQTDVDFDHERTMIMGVVLRESDKQWKSVAFSTIDFAKYKPNLYTAPVSGEHREVFMWIDRWAFDSTSHLGVYGNPSTYESSTWIDSVRYSQFVSSRTNHYIVKNCRLAIKGDDTRLVRVSSVQYPDPPSILSFLGAARDYILEPLAMGALATLASGMNPVAGLVAGGTTLGKNIVQNVAASSRDSQRVKELEEKMKQKEEKLLTPAATAPPNTEPEKRRDSPTEMIHHATS